MRKALHPHEDPPPSVRGKVQSRGGTIVDVIQREKGDNHLEEFILVALKPDFKTGGWTGGVVFGTDCSIDCGKSQVGDLASEFQLLASIVRREELLRGVHDGFGVVIIVVPKADGNLVERGGHADKVYKPVDDFIRAIQPQVN